MIGAIIGDLVGSRFEYDGYNHTEDYEFFDDDCRFTDDTVMTVAVGDVLVRTFIDGKYDELDERLFISLQKYGHRHPRAGYGGAFRKWLKDGYNAQPYLSFGNGSAMRVSRAGWLYDTIEKTREIAKKTAVVTHNHHEGIKGAEATASAIFMARNGATKEEILEYIVKEFGYDFSASLAEMADSDDMRPICQVTMPIVFRAFADSVDFEDAVRKAIYVGGDTDTNAAIVGSIAEAYYGIPVWIQAEIWEYLSDDVAEVVRKFEDAIGRNDWYKEKREEFAKNRIIKDILENFEDDVDENYIRLGAALIMRMRQFGRVPVPVVNRKKSDIKPDDVILESDDDTVTVIEGVKDEFNQLWIPLFTDEDEIEEGEMSHFRKDVVIEDLILRVTESDSVCGIVVNPFSKAVNINSENLTALLAVSHKNDILS